VLEPQSTVLFLLLLVVFVGLVAWMALARQPVFRVFAACLAFIPAMLFGVAAVNKYYDYYQTWGALAADLGGQGTTQVASAPTMDRASARQISAILGSKVNLKAAAEHGQTIRMTVPGKLSHLSRTAYVYLPPQYFRAGYSRFHFPVIELFPGFPGTPVDWINVMGFTTAYAALLADGVVKPAVLVMPDTNGGTRISLQCLNVRHGPQDATYLAVDLPSYLPTVLRVQPPGPAWGVAGYSEGGYCAANLALVYRQHWGAAGILSGYFTPSKDQLGNPPRLVDPFGHDKHALRENTPRLRIAALPVSDSIPQFWLGVGGRDVLGLRDARNFQRLLIARQPTARLDIVPGGTHTMATWRDLTPPLLEWMTPLLTQAAEHPSQFHQLGKARVTHTRRHGKAAVKVAGGGSVRGQATPPA
jgi:enterochelin esterase-like enzyme